MIKKIDIYILRQVTKPLLITLGISAMLLLLERMLRLFDLVVNKGGPFLVVFKMLGNLLPHYLTLAMPAGLFLGVLLAFRKLSLSSEMDSMQASGVSPSGLLRPTVALAVVLVAVSLTLTGYVQPLSRYAYRSLVFDLSSGAFGASINSGEYNKLGHDLTLRIEESRDEGQKLLHIFIQKDHRDGHITTVTAREGSFLSTGDGKTMLLRLFDGVLLDADPTKTSPTVLSFGVHDWPIEMPSVMQFRGRGGEQHEMTLGELWLAINDDSGEPVDPKLVAAFHGRLARALSILVLPFLAGALGIVSKRSGRAFGLAVGVIILLVFHKVLEFGEAFVALGRISPWLGLWLPVALFAALGGRMFHQSAFRVGANPIQWIEDGWNQLFEIIRRLGASRSAAH
ncbi:MAG: LPS export ABC transporter permease LptF [Sphingomonadales bacterium]